MRPPPTWVAALVGLTVLVGCGGREGEGGEDVHDSTSSHPVSMEAAVLDLVTMRQEMVRMLDARLGKRFWRMDPNERSGIGRALCGTAGEGDGEIALLPAIGIDGSYPEAQWKAAARLVEKVGREHGFTDVRVVVDEPGNVEIEGRDRTGAQYVFGQGGHTGLLITSGCHVWATPPPDGRRAREPEPGPGPTR